MTSTRLPGKVLLPLAGASILSHVLERVGCAPGVDASCVAAPDGKAHDAIAHEAARLGVACIRGPERDVLRRMRLASDAMGAGVVVRVTSDCPLTDPAVVGETVALLHTESAAYAATALDSGFPIGLDVEALDADVLREADDEASDAYEREHVTAFVWRRPERYGAAWLERRPDRRGWRLAVDTPEDYAVVRSIYAALHPRTRFGFDEIEALLIRHPELLAPSRHVMQRPYVLAEAGR